MTGTTALTYPEVGASAREPLPAGYHHVRASRSLGLVDFDSVAEILMTWQVQERSGVHLISGPERASVGADVTFRFLGQVIPCRVVEIVDEPDRRGFAYGTLPGHPETGEERFVAERNSITGEVTVTIKAFSNPGSWKTKLIGPAGRALQTMMTQRYLKAMRP
ncbi:MAG: hypothetical protein JWQ70_82 [Aeromicrobium sp.]|nr:hypothetical protein [Aeromicrobium sp.]